MSIRPTGCLGGAGFHVGGRGGLALSSIKVKGVGIGIAGVLFAGIIFGHFGFHVETEILEFVREFGLILFVYTIGLQLGPGFFASFRKQGLKLNVLAHVRGRSWGAPSSLSSRSSFCDIDIVAALGLFFGRHHQHALTRRNPANLEESRRNRRRPGHNPCRWLTRLRIPGAFSASSPSCFFSAGIFRINPEKEAEAFRAEQKQGHRSAWSA